MHVFLLCGGSIWGDFICLTYLQVCGCSLSAPPLTKLTLVKLTPAPPFSLKVNCCTEWSEWRPTVALALFPVRLCLKSMRAAWTKCNLAFAVPLLVAVQHVKCPISVSGSRYYFSPTQIIFFFLLLIKDVSCRLSGPLSALYGLLLFSPPPSLVSPFLSHLTFPTMCKFTASHLLYRIPGSFCYMWKKRKKSQTIKYASFYVGCISLLCPLSFFFHFFLF